MNASTGVPVPTSNSTRTGVKKFVPVMRMISPPCGRPMFGVIEEIVGTGSGVQRGSGGTHGTTGRNVTSRVRTTLLTVAVMCEVPAVEEVRLTVATPFVVVRMIEVT